MEAHHQKHSREKAAMNPEVLPGVWVGATSTEATTTATASTAPNNIQETATSGVEEVSRVNPAPTPSDSNLFGETFDTTSEQSNIGDTTSMEMTNAPQQQVTPCRIPSIQGTMQKLTSFGSHSTKNPGIVLRYRYELVQDLTGIDWTINSKGERDGTDYLVESVLPEVEQGIIGEVLVPTFFDECRKRGLRRLATSSVVGVDMKPDDFPLPQTGKLSPFLLSFVGYLLTSCNLIQSCLLSSCHRMYFQLCIARSTQVHPMPSYRRSNDTVL